MITLEPDYTRGAVRLFGITPNGPMTVIRRVTGMPDVLVRGGAYTVTDGGLVLLDTEAPYSVDLQYLVTVTGISAAERLIQQNLMPTPTFTHGLQGWLAGTGRPALAVVTDPTAHSTAVGNVGPITGQSAPPAVPVFVGHVDSGVSVNSAYTLTPAVSGGTAIATNDQMILVHEQLTSASVPSNPAGWTLVTQRVDGPITRFIWYRKRLVGDSGVTVGAGAGSNSIGTLFWVRGAADGVTFGSEPPPMTPGGSSSLSTPGRTVLMGHLAIAVLDGYTTASQALPTSGAITGGTWQYTIGPATGQRSITVATASDAQGGPTPPVTTTYGGPLTAGGALTLMFQTSGTLTARVIARAKMTALAAAPDPYLLTGRIRYVSPGLKTWADVRNEGTWQHLKDTYPTWLAVQGVDAAAGVDFTRLFITIVDPATGTDYVEPIQVLGGGDDQVNTWLDFSAFVPVGTTIPATAEIRLLHGSTLAEYKASWFLDEFGITPGDQLAAHDTLYWFDGDTPVPADSAARLFTDGSWGGITNDATIGWAGTAGNSISNFYAASGLQARSMTFLTLPDDVRVPSEPVLLSDPLGLDLWCWVGLLDPGDLTHPIRQAIFQVINRPDSVANSQVRSWETGELRVITHTLQERDRLLGLVSTGRVLLIRNPETEYPENNWYLAIGDITESRVIPNARKYERAWTLPFVRVAQPVSFPPVTVTNTWLDVRQGRTWAQVKTRWDSWQDVLTDKA